MTALERITQLLAQCASNDRHLPPTALYNEGWMLRLILDWCSEHPSAVQSFVFLPGSRWYSEALLPSRFGGKGGAREGFTHADGVIGHFGFRPGGRGDIELAQDARPLSVVEAKMGSLLSSGTSNAPLYNQAARNVACMAHLTAVANREASTLEYLSFTVIAPQQRITERAFDAQLGLESLMDSVRARTKMFMGAHDDWLALHFETLLGCCRVEGVSWEQTIEAIAVIDPTTGDDLKGFLTLCLKHNPMSRTRLVKKSGESIARAV